jgi:hypothetical protein
MAQAAEAARRADATEKKVAVLTAGFMKRAASLSTQVACSHSFRTSCSKLPSVQNRSMASQMLHMTKVCFSRRILWYVSLLTQVAPSSSSLSPTPLQLREAEQQVLPIRMQELQERLQALQAKESEYQARYSELARALATQ